MNNVDVRRSLMDTLRLDLVGPENGSALEREVLLQAPSRWYLMGFLVPLEAERWYPGPEAGGQRESTD